MLPGRSERGKTCVVVEDDARLRTTLVSALAAREFVVREAGSVKDALAALAEGSPDLLVLDVALPDGRALDVLRAVAELAPTPCVIAVSGAAGPDESFRLAELGVRAYLRKPFDLAELEAAVERALSEPPDLMPHLKSAVGLTPIKNVEQTVRTTMVQEALARAKGSRRAAARVLNISRQLLQHILRKG
jgi:two-component system, response regulator RegA